MKAILQQKHSLAATQHYFGRGGIRNEENWQNCERTPKQLWRTCEMFVYGDIANRLCKSVLKVATSEFEHFR